MNEAPKSAQAPDIGLTFIRGCYFQCHSTTTFTTRTSMLKQDELESLDLFIPP